MTVTFRHFLTDREEWVSEGGYRELGFTLRDLQEQLLPAANLDSLVLTLYDQRTKTIINSRDGQDVLNANGGTYTGDENTAEGRMILTPDDNVIINTARRYEYHVLRFDYGWDADVNKQSTDEIYIVVVNLEEV